MELSATGEVTVRTDMTDIGTGTYTILTQIAADTLNTSVDNVTVKLGDSRYPSSCGSGGSFGAASSGSAVKKAISAYRVLSHFPALAKLKYKFRWANKVSLIAQGDDDEVSRPVLLANFVSDGDFPISATGSVSKMT